MKKNLLFVLMAVLPLLVLSCAKEVAVEAPETPQEELPTMIDPWTAIDQSPYMQKATGPVSTLQAGFVETKSHMEMNGADTFAKVVWDADDQFDMFAWNGSTYSSAHYTTLSGGEKAVFNGVGTISATPQHSIFWGGSAGQLGHNEDKGEFFGLNLPAEQEAVAGRVNDSYLYSYARSTTQGDHLTFRSIVALVRFKLSGSIASSVKSVTLRAATPIAGDFVFVPTIDGVPAITRTLSFPGNTTSNTVTLTLPWDASFSADTWYYFAVLPGTQSGISLVFSDGSGNSTTKIGSKTVIFARGEVSDLGTINLGDAFTDSGAPDMSTIKFMSATVSAPIQPVTIAVIPDGFTTSEMSKYEMLAKMAMNTLFNVEPFKSYKEYFNVYIMKVASNESGANITDGHGTITTPVDCYFGSKWGAGKNNYGDMAADASKVFQFVTDNCPDITGGIHSIEEVPILMIINDARYGGICHFDSSGKGYCMAPYSNEGAPLKWYYPDIEAVSDSDPSQGATTTPKERAAEVGQNVGNWLNTMVHEFGGHCFSRLSDEYWYDSVYSATPYISTHRWDNPPYYGVPVGLNISATYTNPGYDDPRVNNPPDEPYKSELGPEHVKEGWQHLLDKKATLVASNPLYNRIGVFQGGEVSILNRWRSERISCMIDNRFYFSTFQRELIVKRIMSLSGDIFDEVSFWAKDDPRDPVRDIVSSSVMAQEDPVSPRPMPMLPPPVFHTDW